jgi:hypothetical protein
MEAELTRPETIDSMLRIASWSVIGFAALWLVTSIIGVFYRNAYNLSHAESGSTERVTPDFLRVDKAKREAAIGRGQAYDKTLTDRETAAKTVKVVRSWSRILATAAAFIGLFTAVLGAIEKIEVYQDRLREYSSWDRLVDLASLNPLGSAVGVAVIAANVYLFVKKVQKPE